MTNIHRKDFDTYGEYHREQMRIYNKQKHMKQRQERYRELLSIIRGMELEVSDDNCIADKLANTCVYKLIKDKDFSK